MELPAKNKILLAPMEEVNDIAFRLLCKKAGAGLTYTGLTNPLTKQDLDLDDKPILQLFCTNTRGIKEFMKKYDSKVAGWDFNLGCPAKTARQGKFGAFMASELETIEEILKTMRENTQKSLGVKIRKSRYSNKILKIAEKYCDVIAIHPRTINQAYGGEPDLNFAKEFKKRAKIPVIYSGNVNKENSKELLKIFDYVMIGREAIGRPSAFGGKRISYEQYLEVAKKYKLPFRQLKFQAMQFTKGLEGSAQIRAKLVFAKNLKEIREILEISS